MGGIAASFAMPFRSLSRASWLVGSLLVLLFPVGLVILLGHSVNVTRSARAGGDRMPGLRLTRRGALEGAAVTGLGLLLTAPFAVALVPLQAHLLPALARGGLGAGGLQQPVAVVIAAGLLSLPWALTMLALVPTGVAALARSGQIADLFAVTSSLRTVRTRFPVWNVVTAAIVSAWLLGLAAVAACGVGALPGVLYAILVSAHASAALEP